jgi:hypothetical protein
MKTPLRFLFALLATLTLMKAENAAAPQNLQLFLLIGQSNMAGRGPIGPEDRVPHPRVFMFNKKYAWVPAVDPVHFDKPAIAGVGLASTFARVIADERPGAVIGLIPAAFGGTSLAEWRTDGPLYMNAIDRAKEAMAQGTLVGILWHQGEADIPAELAATYPERFAALIKQLRHDLNAENVPVVVGEIGRFVQDHEAINAALAKVPQVVPHCEFVSAEGLTDKGDQLHFDTPSLHEFGRRYAKAWAELEKR